MDKGHWIFEHDFDIDDWFGFIYRIIEIDTGKEYLGKKQFHSYRTKQLKNKKTKTHYKKESDWKTYTGSCTKLNEAISCSDPSKYLYYIESLHATRASLRYAEVAIQVLEDVLRAKLESGERKYYNGHIGGVKFLPPVETSEETRMKRSRQMSGEGNHMYGKPSQFKGMTFEQRHGENAESIMEILRTQCSHRGADHGMFGKTHSEEMREKWRTDERRIHYGEDNGMFGKPCYYNMTVEEKDSWRRNIGLATKDKPKSEEHKAAMKDAWHNDPDRREIYSKRRSDQNKNQSDAHKEATRQSNKQRGRNKTLNKVSTNTLAYQAIIDELDSGRGVKDIAVAVGVSYRAVWDVSKNLDYYRELLIEALSAQRSDSTD